MFSRRWLAWHCSLSVLLDIQALIAPWFSCNWKLKEMLLTLGMGPKYLHWSYARNPLYPTISTVRRLGIQRSEYWEHWDSWILVQFSLLSREDHLLGLILASRHCRCPSWPLFV